MVCMYIYHVMLGICITRSGIEPTSFPLMRRALKRCTARSSHQEECLAWEEHQLGTLLYTCCSLNERHNRFGKGLFVHKYMYIHVICIYYWSMNTISPSLDVLQRNNITCSIPLLGWEGEPTYNICVQDGRPLQFYF